jgi:predicted MFS family arabinose efflux permease
LTATDLGIGLGAIMLGWVSQYMGYQALFAVSAVSVMFSLLMFTFFVKRLLKDNRLKPANPSTFLSEADANRPSLTK